MVGLNQDGTPYADEASLERPNTWMPLTVQSTMLTSTVWDAIRGAISGGRLELPPALESNEYLPLVLGFEFEIILGLLKGEVPEEFKPILDVLNIDVDVLLRNEVNKLFASWEDLTGFSEVTDEQYQLIIDALGATVDIIDNLVPVTFDAAKPVIMPIQGEQIPLLIGDYGIRAMGIDTLFNVGSYAAPTHLRIVAPVYDKATVTAATIADQYRVGEDEYEIGTIYANTTEGVKLTGTIDLTGHSVTSVLVQYEDATGTWVNIGPATVDDGTFEISWDVSDFDALLAAGSTVAGSTVNVQAVATNALQLTDPNPMAFSINLDADDYPPEVLDIVVDSIEKTNPDSGGPQGMVIIKAYTLSQTGPETVKVRFELTQSDGTTISYEVENGVLPTDIADTVQAALASAIGGTNASVNPDDYHEWELTVDTTELADTITKDNLVARRDHTKDNNRYTIRAFPVSGDATEWPL